MGHVQAPLAWAGQGEFVMIGHVTLCVVVECYAGYKADERPLRFTLSGPGKSDAGREASDEPAHRAAPRTYEVKEVLDQWYGVGYQCFKVLADDGNLYILRHHHDEDVWTLDSFRRESEAECGKVKGRKSNGKS
jgi:hypothetical protein